MLSLVAKGLKTKNEKMAVEHRKLKKRRQTYTGYIRTSLARVLNIKICIQYFTYVSTFYQNEIKLSLRLLCVFILYLTDWHVQWVILVSWGYIICIYFLMFISPKDSANLLSLYTMSEMIRSQLWANMM